MFRKIVTELAYSPALAGNLGYYVKQLREETSRRQIGLVFVILAITVQLFAALSAPESANANNPDVFIDGGIQSINEYLTYYDQNTRNSRNLLTSLGITRSELEATQLAEISSMTTAFSWSSENYREEDSNVLFFTAPGTTSGVAYYRPFSPSETNSLAFIGSSSQLGGKFAITKDSATLLTEKEPGSICTNLSSSPTPQVRVDSWFDSSDHNCSSLLEASLSARGISTDSPIQKLQASDRIAYTLSVTNKSDTAISITPLVNLQDALEYSRILDYGGGEYNFDTRNLSWPTTTVEAGGSIERTLITQLLPTIPATARGEYVRMSYDCTVTLSFGNTISNPVECPPAKYMEQLTSILPSLPTNLNIIAPICLVIISLFLYLRSRQLLTELYIIRHNHTGGL